MDLLREGSGEGRACAVSSQRENSVKKRAQALCVRECVWIYSDFIATCYFHGGTSVNGVLVPPGGACGSRILPLAHKPVKLFG